MAMTDMRHDKRLRSRDGGIVTDRCGEVRAELRLAALALCHDHEPLGNSDGNLRAMPLTYERQRQVNAGRDAR